MSLRYVWTVWDKSHSVNKTTKYTTKTTIYSGTGHYPTKQYYYSSSYTINANGSITLTNPQSRSWPYSSNEPRGTYWALSATSTTIYTGGKLETEQWSDASGNDTEWYMYVHGESSTVYQLKGSYSKGTTQYANVASNTSSAYPANSYSGDYWYVLLGSDTIDPSALTMTGEVKAGSTVNLTITPSATIAYGGTVTYTVQTTTDGNNWYDAGTTTDTTMTLTVPEAAAWNARVIASDDTGFTSTTAVYANGSEDLVSVINVGFIPKSGWIGYKNTKNLLIVSATGTAGETVNISASLDGTQVITGSTTSGVSYQLALTDEQFAAVTEGESHTLTVTAQYATSGTSDTRTYTFRKFTYDETSEGGVMEGSARAIREKNGTESTILGSKIPYEIIQIGAGGTALPEDVRAGKTFFTEEGWKAGNSTAGEVVTLTTSVADKANTSVNITLPEGYKQIVVFSKASYTSNTYQALEAYVGGNWYSVFQGSYLYPKHSTLSGTTLTLKTGSTQVATGGTWSITCYAIT